MRQSTDLETDLWRALRIAGHLQIAETMCETRLRAALPGSDMSAKWTIRLSAVRTDVALANDTSELWLDAMAPCSEFLKKYPASERTNWVAYQAALVELAASRDAVLTLLAAAAPDKARPGILQIVRRTIESLTNLIAKIDKQETSAAVTAEQLRGLNADARLSLSEALLLRHRCYPDRSDDALAAAVEAERVAVELLRTWPSDTEKGSQATRLRVLSRLAIADVSGASELAKLLVDSRDPESIAAVARVLLAQQKFEQADELLQRSPNTHGEIELVRLELLMRKEPAGSEISQRLASIESQQGRYWRRRAELETLKQDSTNSARPEVDETRAMQMVAAGDFGAAADLLRKSAQTARSRGDDQLAMRMSIRAAASLIKAERVNEAISTFRHAATIDPQHQQAAPVHLQACWLVGKKPNEEPDAFIDILGEHLRNWPDDSTSDQAINWLMNYGRQLDRPDLIVPALLSVPESSKRCVDTLALACGLTIEYLRELWSKDAVESETVAMQFADDFQKANRFGSRYAGRIRVLFAADIGTVEPLEDDPLIENVRKVRNHFFENLDTLKVAIAGVSPEEQAWLSDAARRLVRDGRSQAAMPLGMYAQAILDLLERGPDFGDAVWLKVHAESWLGHWDTAIKLALDEPLQGRWTTESIGTYWGNIPQRKSRQAALRLWDAIATRSVIGSPRWLDARYETARLLIAMDRKDEAKQVIGYVVATTSKDQSQKFTELETE